MTLRQALGERIFYLPYLFIPRAVRDVRLEYIGGC